MDFSALPAQWGWIALILGGVAFIMAVQPFAQMMWGRPKISLVFRTEDREENCFYNCEIHNMPVTNRLLRKLGVRRELAQDVTAAFEIQEKGTGRVICPLTIAFIKTQTGVGAERISLPASWFPAIFAIVFVNKVNSEVGVCVMKEGKTLLPLGTYTALVQVVVGGDRHFDGCDFTVQNEYPFVH